MTGGIWIVAEQFSGKLETVSLELLTRALALKAEREMPVCAMLFAPPEFPDSELRRLIDCGADAVYVAAHPLCRGIDTDGAQRVHPPVSHRY